MPTVYNAGWVAEMQTSVSQSVYCQNGVALVSTYLGSASCDGVAYVERMTAGNTCTLSQSGAYRYKTDCSAMGRIAPGLTATFLASAVLLHLCVSSGNDSQVSLLTYTCIVVDRK